LPLTFDRNAPSGVGTLVSVAPGIRRIVANNPSPFTFTGTCTYVVGHGAVTVIDPGPEDDAHIAALLAALHGEKVAQILVTHTHRDHSPGAQRLKALTGAPIAGCGPHVAARETHLGETNRLDASADRDYAPDRILEDGARLEVGDCAFIALETPGHTMNHLAFELEGTGMVFSGDHVMAWSTSIVAPPDGAMGPYLKSLEKLITREDDRAYWPGHGGPVSDPRRFTRALLSHRRQRETQILDLLRQGPATIPAMVEVNYPGLAPALKGAAALSSFAHLEELVRAGQVETEGPPTLESLFARR
jgi:glyoxylase-like metal-dependent hydrolase (beta-lactamase superfamily II)